MFKPILFFLVIFLCSGNLFAAIQAQIDKTNVASDETLTLTISSQDHLSISPNLEPLKHDFDIVGTSRSSQLNLINGSMRMEVQWQVSLLPKHSGDIIIPSLQVGSEKTSEQMVHVSVDKPIKVSTGSSNSDIYIEASVSPKESFVQEQFLYTLKVYFNQSIENAYLVPPDLTNAKISQSGQDIIYTAAKKGKFYRVLERSYLITPLKAGDFQVQSPILKGYLERSPESLSVYGFPNRVLKSIKVVGPSLKIHVKPKPANFLGQWLPAKKVTVTDSWKTHPPTFREGEPIARQIQVSAEGTSGEQIPAIQLKTASDVNSYLDQPSRDTQVVNGLQVGTLKQRVVFIPTVAGKVVIPGIKVKWWNSQKQREEVTTLRDMTVNVLPTLSRTTPALIKKYNPPTNLSSKAVPSLQQFSRDHGIGERKVTSRLSLWPIIAISFILLWLVTVWLWRRQVSQQRHISQHNHGISELKQRLKRACAKNDAVSARECFLVWVSLFWNDSTIHNLPEVILRLKKEKADLFIAEIMQLEAALYKRRSKDWSGNSFWEALNHYLANRPGQSDEKEEDPLPPLYCTD